LRKLPNSSKVLRQVEKTLRFVQAGKIDQLLNSGLLQYIDDLQVEIGKIHQKIADTWFLQYLSRGTN